MTRVKYDVKGVEPGQDFDTPVPVGLYRARISECEQRISKSSGNDMLAITLEIVHDEKWEGRNLWDYIVLNDASAWKLKQLVDALSLKDKGTLDTNKIEGEMVQVRVKHETDEEYGTRAKVGMLLALPDDEEEEEEEEEEEVEDDEEEEEEEVDVPEDYEELEALDREEMELLVEQEELDVTFNKRTNDDKLRERIAEAMDIEEEEEEDDEEEEEDYSEMSIKDLKTELKSRGLATSGTKKALVKRLEKDDESGDEDEPF